MVKAQAVLGEVPHISLSVAVASSFHGSPARVGLLGQAARGLHAQLQARGVDNLLKVAVQAQISFRPFPGPFWDVKALKNPPPTPGLNSSLKNTPQIQKCNLEREAGF